MPTNKCPCGTNKPFANCCAMIWQQPKLATHPEQIMRARYSAHVKNNMAFIAASWHGLTRPQNMADVAAWNSSCTWLGLKVISSSRNGNKGKVEFTALYKQGSELNQHHELAEFVFENEQWWYLDRD